MNSSIDVFFCIGEKNPADILKIVRKTEFADNFFFTNNSCIYKQDSHLLFVDGKQSRVTRLRPLGRSADQVM